MLQGQDNLVNMDMFRAVRAQLGSNFVRILGYFREDGTKAVAMIEVAMRDRNAAAIILPAHTLKGEARQFGANELALLAEDIETFARRCVEHHQSPEEYLPKVVQIRPMFEATLAILERETSPLMQRRPVFGKAAAFMDGAKR
jgi:histidine phosphotransfer protein HptB